MLSLVNDLRATPWRRFAHSSRRVARIGKRVGGAHGRFARHLPLAAQHAGDIQVDQSGRERRDRLSVAAAERALEASPGHLVNLVNPAFNYIGIGIARGSDGGVYVAQEFMQARAGACRVAIPTAHAPRTGAGVRSCAPAQRAPPPQAPPPPPPPPASAPAATGAIAPAGRCLRPAARPRCRRSRAEVTGSCA